MEAFIHAATQMGILCAIAICGFIARKKGMMTNDFDAKLSTLVMTFCCPALTLNSVLSNTSMPGTDVIASLFGYSFAIYAVSVIFSFLFVRYLYRGIKPATKGAHAFIICFPNVGFIGFAVIASLFGNDAVLMAAVYNIPYNVFLFSVGMLFISRTGTRERTSDGERSKSRKQEIKAICKCFYSPVMIASYLAIILAMLHITDSGPVGTAINMLGNATIPIAMLITGSSLAKMPLKEMFNDAWSYLTTFMRLIAIPLVIFLIFNQFVEDKTMLAIMVVLAATPTATVGTMMCVSYGGDLNTMTRGTFLTTVLSLITIPLIAMLVM